MDKNFIYGIHPIQEAFKALQRRCRKIVIEQGKTKPRLKSVLDQALAMEIRIEKLPQTVFQKKYQSYPHQGIVGYFNEKEILSLEAMVQKAFEASKNPTVVILDSIQDPQNLGAIIRSAEVLGIQGIILPKHRTASLNETVAKCSAGAVDHLPIAGVTNLNQALKELKQADFWIVALDPRGEKPCYEFKFDMPTALLVGGEAKGIRPLLKKACDFTISIPVQGAVDSLNASAASVVIFYEILRQKKQTCPEKGAP